MHERIKEIRKNEKLTQAQLGEKLGTSRDNIANVENNRVTLTELFINHFCREFNVNKKWLTTGEGDPYLSFLNKQDSVLTEIFAEITIDENHKLRTVIEKLSKLDDEYLDAIEKLIEGLIKK
ncbi:helix-turn-helix transcriptional regulator [Romboutsia sp.]|uniref:helix-turn-helix domain-containing protein n=1 Tax=Romboutsia sp. TaxID=1965302 RepID=UPI002C60C9F0|nr:helix-turn-helix transcriptional regulator [Romboutsia sp.]HSQ88709.1 helix-turn-helix transcriptional regulator [Romboutsia sp.]